MEEAQQILAQARMEAEAIRQQAKADEAAAKQRIGQQLQAASDLLDAKHKQAVNAAVMLITTALVQNLMSQLERLVKAAAMRPELINELVAQMVKRKAETGEVAVTVPQADAEALLGELIRSVGETIVTTHGDPRFKDSVVISVADGDVQLTIDKEELTRAILEAIPMPKLKG
jgi:vacuolar-type H+-ATPase subunit E/Vma4